MAILSPKASGYYFFLSTYRPDVHLHVSVILWILPAEDISSVHVSILLYKPSANEVACVRLLTAAPEVTQFTHHVPPFPLSVPEFCYLNSDTQVVEDSPLTTPHPPSLCYLPGLSPSNTFARNN